MSTHSVGELSSSDGRAPYDLADPAVHAEYDLREFWRELRQDIPVFPAASSGTAYWVLTRHHDVKQLLLNSDLFSSDRGNVIDNLLVGGDSAGGRMLVLSDGDHHRSTASLVRRGFSARWLEQVVAGVRADAETLVNRAVAARECDFARDVAAPIPQAAVCRMMGVPPEDREYLMGLTSAALGSPGTPPTAESMWEAKNETIAYFADLLTRPDFTTGDDGTLLALMRTDHGGVPALGVEETALNAYSFLLAGEETTRLAMSAAVVVLTEQPSLWPRLRTDGVQMRRLVEEILRWSTPALHVARTATQDFTLHDAAISEGDIVTGWMASANRDGDVFDRPETFDPDRVDNPHLSFGYGAHVCLGAYLARTELTAVLTALGAAADAAVRTGDGIRVYSNFLSGFVSLPVEFRRRP